MSHGLFHPVLSGNTRTLFNDFNVHRHPPLFTFLTQWYLLISGQTSRRYVSCSHKPRGLGSKNPKFAASRELWKPPPSPCSSTFPLHHPPELWLDRTYRLCRLGRPHPTLRIS
ncbi:hypothetical protein LshimejAT787_1701900 [Lyophyllum shimeji]|uniref:Uncharacterized protein n=1 Tax=Lyophyllum shimeji TaxID=47721 RepID=A0A9P3PYV7_LYOSH|nr:hypothetical protein LshimejAT787_1701900 [Lyophyllum shimeji]